MQHGSPFGLRERPKLHGPRLSGPSFVAGSLPEGPDAAVRAAHNTNFAFPNLEAFGNALGSCAPHMPPSFFKCAASAKEALLFRAPAVAFLLVLLSRNHLPLPPFEFAMRSLGAHNHQRHPPLMSQRLAGLWRASTLYFLDDC